jgi:hypothetical protein
VENVSQTRVKKTVSGGVDGDDTRLCVEREREGRMRLLQRSFWKRETREPFRHFHPVKHVNENRRDGPSCAVCTCLLHDLISGFLFCTLLTGEGGMVLSLRVFVCMCEWVRTCTRIHLRRFALCVCLECFCSLWFSLFSFSASRTSCHRCQPWRCAGGRCSGSSWTAGGSHRR